MSLHAPSKWSICVRHDMLGNAQSVFHIIHKIATQRWHYSILPRVLTCTECVMRYTVVFRKITKYFTFISLPSSCCKFIISGCMYIRCLRRSAPVGKESSPSYIALCDMKCKHRPVKLPYRHGFFPNDFRMANCSFRPVCRSSGVVRGTPSPISRR